MNYLDKYKLVYDKQFGFKEGVSTQDAIRFLTAGISENLETSKPSLCIFLDLAKAFDTVDHSQLLEALQHMGFSGNAYDPMESYLKDREQCVKIDNTMSERGIVECEAQLFLQYISTIFWNMILLEFRFASPMIPLYYIVLRLGTN